MAKLCCQADDKANKVPFCLSTWPCGYVSHVNGLSIDNNNNETSAMPAAATVCVCVPCCIMCVCCCCSFLFVSCIIVIKILQFLAQFRAPSPPSPPRCHLTLTTVQLPYQRQSTLPSPIPDQSANPLSTKSTIHCEGEREREQQERAQQGGGTKRDKEKS